LGARPLKRLIQQVVVNPLARLVLEGRLRAGELAALRVVEGELRVEGGYRGRQNIISMGKNLLDPVPNSSIVHSV